MAIRGTDIKKGKVTEGALPFTYDPDSAAARQQLEIAGKNALGRSERSRKPSVKADAVLVAVESPKKTYSGLWQAVSIAHVIHRSGEKHKKHGALSRFTAKSRKK